MSTTLISKAEKSFIQAGLLLNPPTRADGRALQDFRTISLETSVAPLANGSARLSIGRNPYDGSGGTEVLAATKLEVETIQHGSGGVEGGKIACSVTWYIPPNPKSATTKTNRNYYKNLPARKALQQHIHTSLLPRWMTFNMI